MYTVASSPCSPRPPAILCALDQIRVLIVSADVRPVGAHDGELGAGEVTVPSEFVQPQLDPAGQERRAPPSVTGAISR